MKLWHDDIRRPPDDSWTWARTNREAQLLLLTHADSCDPVTEASLDHDLGLHDFDPDEQDADLRVAPDAHLQPDGQQLVRWMLRNELVPPKVTIHSWNPVGAKSMAALLGEGGCSEVLVEPFDLAVRT